MEGNSLELTKFSIPPPTVGRNIWLRVGTLLDGFSLEPLKDAHVVYDAQSILYVGAAGDSPPAGILNPGQTQPDLELEDYILLPGLIEAHAHLFLAGGELHGEKRRATLRLTPKELLRATQDRLESLVRIGIIAVRDAGDKHGVGLSLSKLSDSADKPLMPYIDSPGAAIHHSGRYGGFMAEPIEDHDSLKACVESRIRLGADRIKLIATGIIDFEAGRVTAKPQMPSNEVAALVSAAKSFGKQTFAHASGDAGIENVIEGRVDSIEHGFFIREDQLGRMRERQLAWVPTFAPLQKQIEHAGELGSNERVISNLRRILDGHVASLAKAHAMGVQIIAGSDAGSCGVAHGLGLLDELKLMVQAGLPALSVINAATGNSSNRLGFKEKFGQVKPGYRSRFILTQFSPLEDISNLSKRKYVVYDGTVYNSDSSIDSAGL